MMAPQKLRTLLVFGLVGGISTGAGCSSEDAGAPAGGDAAPFDVTADAPTSEATAEAAPADGPDFGAPSDTYPGYTPPPLPKASTRNAPVLKDFTVVPVLFSGD